MTILGPLASRRPLTSADLRLASGLGLGIFITSHFLNHALGLVSLSAMEAARPFLSAPWRTAPGTLVLYGSLAVHYVLTLKSLYRRQTPRMPAKELCQVAFGLALPFLLLGHVAGTRMSFALTGHEPTYPGVVEGLWIRSPWGGVQQVAALLVAWLHLCLGLYFWLRIRPAFPRWQPWLLALALLVPTLSTLGFVAAGKELGLTGGVAQRSADETPPPWVVPAMGAGLALPVLLVFAAQTRRSVRRRRDLVRIGFPGSRTVDVPRGHSVLEASRRARIPHQSVCGGRARCSTCRVEVVQGASGQPDPTQLERATLQRIKAGPRVRLACQFRPVHDVKVVPLVRAGSLAGLQPGGGIRNVPSDLPGEERDVVVLFCDIRGFTTLAEHRLPFDVVFILNRYFELVGRAVTEHGGVVDKFVGDGAMALFGLSTSGADAATQGLAAAERIIGDMRDLNRALERELIEPLRIVVALHQGPAIVGTIGYGATSSLTAVGDTINVASRLEAAAKAVDAELVVSDEVMQRSAGSHDGFKPKVLDVRGRSLPLEVWMRTPAHKPSAAADHRNIWTSMKRPSSR